MSDKLAAMQQETLSTYSRCESQLTLIQSLQGELSVSVPREQHARVAQQLEGLQRELFEAREQLCTLRERMEKMVREAEEQDKDQKKQLHQMLS